MNKEQELLYIIDSIESAYNPDSPNYKFRFVFYNKTTVPFSRPVDFPEDLWYSSLKKDTTLMPILLKGKEIELRRYEQLNTVKNLEMSYKFLQNKIDQLKLNSDRIKNKLQSILVVYRKLVNNIYNKCRLRKCNCNLMEEIEKINTDISPEELIIDDKKNEVMLFLLKLKDNLCTLVSKIDEELYEYERKMLVFKNINKLA